MLSTIITHTSESLKIKRVIKVLGMVNATPDFKHHPFVIIDLVNFFRSFGEKNGIGVRSAVGMNLQIIYQLRLKLLFNRII